MRIVCALVLATLPAFALPAFAQAANSCNDPYWKDTLRCVFFPGEIPQPNLSNVPGPGTGDPFGTHTRLFITNPDVRCTDGTRPLYYVDKAICTNANGCGNGIRRGDPIESNRWIFTVTGGDSCNGERCAYFYAQPDERGAMGSSTRDPAKDLEGIHEPDPVKNPVFASYNRVRIEKCTFDRYMGRTEEEAQGGAIRATAPNGAPISFNAYYHGFLIMEETFKALEKGLRYTTFQRTPTNPSAKRRSCCGASGGNIPAVIQEALPPLADAEAVLFIGHSNASHGMFHNIDHLAARMAEITDGSADVRVLFDENFLPSVENEAAFATNAPPNKDLYDSLWSGASSGRGEPFTYGETYHATNIIDQDYIAHGAVQDQSCLDTHATDGKNWMCRDRMHVLFNHVATPFMIRQDFTDPNRDHLDAPDGHWVRWGDPADFSYCPGGVKPCKPRFNVAEFRARLEKQIGTLLEGLWTRSEIALRRDTTPASRPTFFAWMPSCNSHEGAFNENGFFGVTVATDTASFSMREWLEEFMAAPRSGVRRYLIDGAADGSGRAMRTTQCRFN